MQHTPTVGVLESCSYVVGDPERILYQELALPLQAGMDDVALALTADAYSRTGRSVAYGVAASRVQSRSGLTWLPDGAPTADTKHRIDAVQTVPGTPVFDSVLASIAGRYGRSTARGVASDFEYSWVPTEQ